MFLFIAGLIFFAIASLEIYVRFSRWGRLITKIPGPRRWPVIGNTMDLLLLNPVTVFKFQCDLYKKYGPISKMQAFQSRFVTIFDPEDIKFVLSSSRFTTKETPYDFIKPWLCEGLLVSNGEKWKQRRKMLTPAFHNNNILKSFCGTFNEHTNKLLDMIEKETDKEHTEIFKLLTKTTLNVICETSLGTSVSDSQNDPNKYLSAVHEMGTIMVKRFLCIPYHVDCIYNLSILARKQKSLLKDLHGFSTKIIQKRMACKESTEVKNEDSDIYGKKERYAMLDLLLKNEKEGQIDINGIREEVDTFIFGGHDTAAAMLCFMIMRIANEPKAQNLIFQEMHKIFGNSTRSPTMEDLNSMTYLECCIKESLRLYPIAHFMTRMLNEDVKLGGYLVPSGTWVQILPYVIHHREDIYPEPEKFIPERFLPHNVAQRHSYAYIPFSAGPRNCIGQKFAKLEIKTLMSGLIRRFRLEPVTRPENITFWAGVVLYTKDPILVRFRPRKTV